MRNRAIGWIACGTLIVAVAAGTTWGGQAGGLPGLSDAIAALQATVADLASRMAGGERKVSDNSTTDAQMQARLTALENRVTTLESKVNALSSGGSGGSGGGGGGGGTGATGPAFGQYVGHTAATYTGNLGGYAAIQQLCTSEF